MTAMVVKSVLAVRHTLGMMTPDIAVSQMCASFLRLSPGNGIAWHAANTFPALTQPTNSMIAASGLTLVHVQLHLVLLRFCATHESPEQSQLLLMMLLSHCDPWYRQCLLETSFLS